MVGVAAMFIAAKYEEIYSPELNDFAYVTDNAYSPSQIITQEGKICKELMFSFTTTSPLSFLKRYGLYANLNLKCFYLAWYLLELSLLDYK